jgi:WbqC-like protein family
MNLIVDLQYFPPSILYKSIGKFSNIVFEQYEHYQKMSFRNRCQIAGAEGVINLSVPLVKGRDQKTLLRDVKISDRGRWQDQHWKTILSCYSRSPWFEFYRDGLGELYGKPFVFLRDWNLACFEWSLEVLKLPLHFEWSLVWQKSYDEREWVDWRGKILPKNTGNRGEPGRVSLNGENGRIEGPTEGARKAGAANIPITDTPNIPTADPEGGVEMSQSTDGFRMVDSTENVEMIGLPGEIRGDQGVSKNLLFAGGSSKVETAIKYRQVFEERTGFLPGLSILDLLFCEGKRAKSLLTGK